MWVTGKNRILKNEKQKRGLFLLLFSITFFAIFLIAYVSFFRNGKSFIWYYDGIKQHYAALVYLGRYYREAAVSFLHGDFTLPMFDFSIGMGEDIVTTLNFYGLGDPLTLAAFVPDAHMEKLYNLLVVFRIYLAGLSFAYMCRKKGKTYSSTFIGALIYCFSGYVLHVAVKHPFFVSPMIFLPLSVIGVERALRQKRLTLLAVMVFLTALNGFYFFYMNTIFLVLYAIVHVLCRRPEAPVRRLFRCAAAYVTGILMSACLFVPVVAAYLSSARSDSASEPGNLFFFSLKRYGMIVSRMVGTPRITWDYLGLVSLLFPALIVLFHSRFKKNMELKVNVILWTALMFVPFGGYALNGFAYVSGRFMYLVTFVYVLAVVEVLPELLHMRRKTLLVCAVWLLPYGAAVLLSGDGKHWYSWFGFCMLAVTLLALLPGAMRKWPRKTVFIVLSGVVAVNVIGNAWLLFMGRAQGYEDEFIEAGTAQPFLEASPEAGIPAEDGTDAFYRVDARGKATENAAMVNGYYGTSSYFSLTNPNRLQYLSEVENSGVLDSMFKIAGLDERTFLETLVSVRYFAAPVGDGTDAVPFGFRFVREYNRGGKRWALYENEFFLPLGITFDSYVKKEDVAASTGIRQQEGMMKTVVLEKEAAGIRKLAEFPESDITGVPFRVLKTKNVKIDGDRVEVRRGGGSLQIQWDQTDPGEWYVRIGGFKITQDKKDTCGITVRCGTQKKTAQALSPAQNWYFGREDYLLNMGLTNEDTCTVRFSCGGTFLLSNLNVYVQKMEHYGETVRERKEDVLQNVSVGKNRVSGEISLSENKMLFLSIPFSSGWRAFVDGRETEIYQADTAFMALALEAGSHRITLQYRTPYLAQGGVASLAGIVIFAVYVVMAGRKERRRGA